MACVLQSSCHSEGLQIPAQVLQSSTRSPTSRAQSKTHAQLTSSRAARPGTEVTLTDAYLRLHINGVVARELCPISAEQFLFVMGADHLRSAFAHLASPRQWSRAPTCNLKGSGAESGSRAYCGLKPLAGFDTCNLWLLFYLFFSPGLMTNMELPGRCVLFAALLMSVPHPVRSGQCFTHVNYSPSRCDQNKLSGCQLNRDSWCLTNDWLERKRWGWFEYAKQNQTLHMHTHPTFRFCWIQPIYRLILNL